MSRQLCFVTWAFGARIHAFVLMSNHFHMLVSTPESNLSEIMANFMKETSRFVNLTSDRINQAYGTRHFRSIIDKEHYFLHAYKYVYRNPVVAHLSEHCEQYQFSSLSFLVGRERVSFPVADQILFGDVEKTLEWLNRKPQGEDWKTIEWSMSRSKFRLPQDSSSRREHRLEFDML